jgi:AraC-like DNA-binding protein
VAVAGYFLMILVQSGAIRVECDEGSPTLIAGSLFLAPPGSRPRIREGAGAVLKSFSFGRSLVDALASESSIDTVVETLAKARPLVARLDAYDFQESRAIFSFLEREASDPRPGYLPILRLKVMELVLLLGRGAARGAGRKVAVGPERGAESIPAIASAGQIAHFKAEELIRFIEERYADQFSLDELAQAFGLSPAYLSRAFSKKTGFTIVEYLNRIRIRKSCVLLKRSRSSILDIALSVGYNSLSHFNRYFRRIMGMSPREFRNRSRR